MRKSRALLAGAALAGVIAPIAGAPVAAAPAEPTSSDAEPLACWTYALTAEQIAQGVTSEITCEPADSVLGRSSPLSSSLSSVILARHWLGYGTGDHFDVYGDSCNGGGVSFAAGSPWNDSISSTEHRYCATVKHWENSNNSGAYQNTGGSPYQLVNLTSLNNLTSAVQYY